MQSLCLPALEHTRSGVLRGDSHGQEERRPVQRQRPPPGLGPHCGPLSPLGVIMSLAPTSATWLLREKSKTTEKWKMIKYAFLYPSHKFSYFLPFCNIDSHLLSLLRVYTFDSICIFLLLFFYSCPSISPFALLCIFSSINYILFH